MNITWNQECIQTFLEKFNSRPLEEFDKEIEKFPEIKKLLHTKVGDMVGTKYECYLNLLMPSDREFFKDNTLHDLMEYTIKAKPLHTRSNYEILYSYNDDIPIGWFYYHYLGDRVDVIKMFSFGTGDITFMRDVRDKFDEICREYNRIDWVAVKANPFIKHYIKAMVKYQGTCMEIEDGKGVMFTIDKHNPCKDYSFLKDIFDEDFLRKYGIKF